MCFSGLKKNYFKWLWNAISITSLLTLKFASNVCMVGVHHELCVFLACIEIASHSALFHQEWKVRTWLVLDFFVFFFCDSLISTTRKSSNVPITTFHRINKIHFFDIELVQTKFSGGYRMWKKPFCVFSSASETGCSVFFDGPPENRE